MSDKMKVRDGNDGYSYPYTSPDLVIDENGKSNTKKFEEIDTQFKDIANLSLTKHTDGKVYIKKQDGTLLGTGIEIGGNDVDLTGYVTKDDLKNVVTYDPEDGDVDYITADNIAFSNENFTSTNVKGALNELFQSASNGKQLIANAITGKGIVTNINDTFETMATNINNIVSGGGTNSIESGSFTPSEYTSSVNITTNSNCSNLILVCSNTNNTDSTRFIYALIVTNICKIFIGSNSTGTSLSAVNINSNIHSFNNNTVTINSGDSKFMPCEYKWLSW